MARHNIDPFSDDGDDNVDGDVATFREEVAKAKGEEDDEGSGRGELAIESLNPSDEFPVGQELSVDPEPPPPSREEKRRERSGLHSALEGQREENARLRERMAAMEARFSQPADISPREPEDEPETREIDALHQQQQDIGALWQANAANMSDAQKREMQDRARGVEDKLFTLKTKREARRLGFQPARSAEEERRTQLANQLHAEHSDLYGDANARQVLLGNFAKARYRGEPESMELHDRVADETRQQLGMPLRGKRPAPSEEQRQRYAGQGRGGGARSSTKGPIRMEKEFYKMADAALGHISDPAKRYQTWARTAGRRLKENGEA